MHSSTNFTNSRPSENRLFSELCIDKEHETVLLHTKYVEGCVLGRLFEAYDYLKKKIHLFPDGKYDNRKDIIRYCS